MRPSMRRASGDRAAHQARARRPGAACGRLARRRERTGAATAATAVDAATWSERRPATLRRPAAENDAAGAARAASTAPAAPRSCARGAAAAQLRAAGGAKPVAPRAEVARSRPLGASRALAALRAAMVRHGRGASELYRRGPPATRAELAIADRALAGGPTLTLSPLRTRCGSWPQLARARGMRRTALLAAALVACASVALARPQDVARVRSLSRSAPA